MYTNNTAPCNDGLYCTTVDTCKDGVCIGSDDPCNDDGDYCNGVEYCTEGADQYTCNSTGDPCNGLLCIDDVCDDSKVSLIIGDAFGTPGTVDISLNNEFDQASEVKVNVCNKDQRPWLHINTTTCTLTARTPDTDFNCALADVGNGCVAVHIIQVDSATIATGTGAIAQLSYTLDANAPSGEFADLNPEAIEVKDELDNLLTVTPVPGRIGAVECTKDAHCDDGNVCTDQYCDAGSYECVYNTVADGTSCDDSTICNGHESCQAGVCTNGASLDCDDINPCTVDTCDPVSGCQNEPLPNGTTCNDGLYCNGSDTCSEGSCSAHAGISCPAGTACDETLDTCIEPTPVFKVSISPASATAYSAGTIQFTAKTRRNGVIVSGDYEWEIANDSGIGSTLTGTGLYTAGNNDTDKDLVETIKVTDTDRNLSATAKVTIKTKSACEVVISPSSAEVKSGDTVEFEALTTCNGEEVAGTYQWAVLSTTIGSTVNASTGLYTAGTTDAEVTDTIQVTDTAHGNITATALVTVTQVTPPVCSITLEPSISTVDSGATITFTATVVGEGCLAPDFDWEVETEINSEITADGASCFYEAGSNTTGILLDDTITVTDDANGTSESVTVTVLYGRITGVFPPALLSSRWLPLFHIMIIFGEDTGFNATSYPTFTPGDALTTIGQIGLGDLMGVLVLLSSNTEEGTVDLAVTTTNGASQEVTFTKDDAFTINLLPFLLDESEKQF